MSMFGDGTVKQEIYDSLRWIKQDRNLTPQQLQRATLEVLVNFMEYPESLEPAQMIQMRVTDFAAITGLDPDEMLRLGTIEPLTTS